MPDNTPRWIKDAQRIAPQPSAKPVYSPAATSRQREVTQAEINRIRATTTTSKTAKN